MMGLALNYCFCYLHVEKFFRGLRLVQKLLHHEVGKFHVIPS